MKAKLTAFTIAFLVVSSLFIAFAQTVDTTKIIPLEKPEEVLVEVITCKEITQKIDSKILQYKTDEPSHSVTFQMLYLKVNATTKKAAVLGYDVSKLELNLIELEGLISDFDKNFKDFIDKYEVIKKYACDVKDDENYAKSYIDTKRALGTVKNTAYDIYELYQDEIRENILGLEMVENGK